MQPLVVQAIQTRIFHVGEDLLAFIIESVPRPLIQERMILAVTSKIVSVSENRLVKKENGDKASLIRTEADIFLGEIGHGSFLTVKNGLLIPSAGIDQSNSESDCYILYPENPFQSASRLWAQLKEAWGLSQLGVIFTDSRTMPLRRGVTGVCLSYYGFHGIKDLVGSKDLFGRELVMTKMNFADGLAGTAVMMMGEGHESRPLGVVSGAEVEFTEYTCADEVRVPFEEDIYYPLLRAFAASAAKA